MDLELRDRVAIVTGGARGIGRAICISFAREGANVVIADVLPEDQRQDRTGKTTEQECLELGVRCSYVNTDVTQLDQVLKMRDEVMAGYGKIDVLVNDAAWWRHSWFWETEPEVWTKEMDIILLGSINCCQAVAEPMMARRSGAIVSIASDAGRVAEKRETTYGAFKAGIIGLTRGLAAELGYFGIRANCVAPGRTMTEAYHESREKALAAGDQEAANYLDREKRALRLYALRKYGTPQDVANMVVFLSSEAAAGHVTGQTISVSGGYSMV